MIEVVFNSIKMPCSHECAQYVSSCGVYQEIEPDGIATKQQK